MEQKLICSGDMNSLRWFRSNRLCRSQKWQPKCFHECTF